MHCWTTHTGSANHSTRHYRTSTAPGGAPTASSTASTTTLASSSSSSSCREATPTEADESKAPPPRRVRLSSIRTGASKDQFSDIERHHEASPSKRYSNEFILVSPQPVRKKVRKRPAEAGRDLVRVSAEITVSSDAPEPLVRQANGVLASAHTGFRNRFQRRSRRRAPLKQPSVFLMAHACTEVIATQHEEHAFGPGRPGGAGRRTPKNVATALQRSCDAHRPASGGNGRAVRDPHAWPSRLRVFRRAF